MTDDVTRRKALLRAAATAYFTALRTKDFAGVPWDDDVVVRSPLAPPNGEVPYEQHPLQGRATVARWFGNLAPNLGDVRVVDFYFNDDLSEVCVRADVDVRQPRCTLRVIDRFVVNGAGRISDQENHYDPRPAMQTA